MLNIPSIVEGQGLGKNELAQLFLWSSSHREAAGTIPFAANAMGLHYLVGGSTGPGYSLLRFDSQEKMELANTTNLSSWISAAIYCCVYVCWSLIANSRTYRYYN